jgi:regulator of protease activity HflC (stomatin/prohibitin superfamily)
VTFGDLVRQVLEHLYGLWPLRIVRDWEQGVRLRLGNATALLTSSNGLFGTGLHAFWPVLGEIIGQDTNIETPETSLQTYTTQDGRTVTFSLAVRYRVKDLRALWLKIHDQEATIQEEIRSAAGSVIVELDFAEMPEQFGPAVAKAAQANMRGWGLEILSVSLVNYTDAQTLRLMTEATGGGWA